MAYFPFIQDDKIYRVGTIDNIYPDYRDIFYANFHVVLKPNSEIEIGVQEKIYPINSRIRANHLETLRLVREAYNQDLQLP